MTNDDNPNVTFLSKLRKIDLRTLTVRDVLVLYAIIKRPGIAGVELAHTLGFTDRSSIASNVLRLEREGFIDDRRLERRKATPAIFHPTQKGLEFWDDIKP